MGGASRNRHIGNIKFHFRALDFLVKWDQVVCFYNYVCGTRKELSISLS